MKKKDDLRKKIFEAYSKADVRTLFTEEEYIDVCKKTAKLEKEIDEVTKKIQKYKDRFKVILMEFLENLTMITNYENDTNREEGKRYSLK